MIDAMIVLLFALGTQSAGDDARARELYNAGSAAYAQAHYSVAIDAFEEARKLSPRAVITFSLAQAYRLQFFIDNDQAKLEKAVELYRAYLVEEPSGGRRDHAAQHLSTLEPLLAAKRAAAQSIEDVPQAAPMGRVIVSSGTPGATARIDGAEPQHIPATFEVPPGEHKFVVEAPGYQATTRVLNAVQGAAVAMNVDLAPLKGTLVVVAPDGALVAVDGRAVANGAPIALNPGRHAIAVSAHGHAPYTHAIEIESGASETVSAELSWTGQSVAGFMALGLGAVLATSALVPGGFGLSVESEAKAIEGAMETRALTVAEAERYGVLEADRDLYVRTAMALAVGGAITATAGAFLLALDRAPPITAGGESAE